MSAPFNPYAFPSHGSMGEVVQEGMSLRDYFAAKAMPAAIKFWQESEPGTLDPEFSFALDGDMHLIAQTAFEMADAMLAAREKS